MLVTVIATLGDDRSMRVTAPLSTLETNSSALSPSSLMVKSQGPSSSSASVSVLTTLLLLSRIVSDPLPTDTRLPLLS